jgi:nucleotide-binding universal stress UspA family protein
MSQARRVLVGYDGSRASRAALAWAETLVRANHGRLTVVMVLNQPWCASGWPGMATPPAGDELERGACKALRAAIDELAPDVSVTSCVLSGPVGAALAREAGRQDCELIVIGRASRLLRPWPGRVERYLRRHAMVPVEVIAYARADDGAGATAAIDAPPPAVAGVRPAL